MDTAWRMQCPITVSSTDIGFQIPDSISVRLGAEQGTIKFSIRLENEYDVEYGVGQTPRYYPNSEAQSFINEFLSLFDQSMICFNEADRVHYRMYTDHIHAAPYGRYEVGYLCRRSLDFLYPQRTALPQFLSGFGMERINTSLTQDGTSLLYIKEAHYIDPDRTEIPFVTQTMIEPISYDPAPAITASTPIDYYYGPQNTTGTTTTIDLNAFVEDICRTIDRINESSRNASDALDAVTYAAGSIRDGKTPAAKKSQELPDGISEELNDFLNGFQRKETNEMILRSAT